MHNTYEVIFKKSNTSPYLTIVSILDLTENNHFKMQERLFQELCSRN